MSGKVGGLNLKLSKFETENILAFMMFFDVLKTLCLHFGHAPRTTKLAVRIGSTNASNTSLVIIRYSAL